MPARRVAAMRIVRMETTIHAATVARVADRGFATAIAFGTVASPGPG